MNFVGNKKTIDYLDDLIKNNNIFHALIFEGISGIGKKKAAIEFAKKALCQNLSSGDKIIPCEICSSCRKINGGNSENLYIIEAAGLSVVDKQIFYIQSIIQKKAYDDGRRFIIIDGGETITPRAQARLLKTLEEPLGNTVIILLVENRSKLALTILSRCVILNFKPLTRKEIKGYLEENFKEEDQKVNACTALAFGSIGNAILLIKEDTVGADREASLSVVKMLIKKESYYKFFEIINNVGATPLKAKSFLKSVQNILRDLLLIKSFSAEKLLLNLDFAEELHEIARLSEIREIIKKIEQTEIIIKDIDQNIGQSYAISKILINC